MGMHLFYDASEGREPELAYDRRPYDCNFNLWATS